MKPHHPVQLHLSPKPFITTDLPIETPPHNGPYQGRLTPRTIPPGQSGSDPPDLMAAYKRKLQRDRNRLWMRRKRAQTRLRQRT